MAVALVPREDNAFANDNPPPARNAVLARYRQLREISKKVGWDLHEAVLMPGAAPRAPPQIQSNFIQESRGSCVRDVQYNQYKKARLPLGHTMDIAKST